MTCRHLVILLALTHFGVACGKRDPIDRLVSQLDEPGQREAAVEQLLVRVRKAPVAQRAQVRDRVLDALAEAYRRDEGRDQIVAALAAIGDRRAAHVFAAALGDADRDGSYYEAAVRSAQMLGELDVKEAVPELVAALRRARQRPRADRQIWLERAIIETLERLRSPQAVPALLEALEADPLRQDWNLNRLAARALGHVGSPKAAGALVRALGATGHGTLLLEEARRAICTIGAAASPEVLAGALARDRRGQPRSNAAAATRLLPDLGTASALPALRRAARPTDPEEYRLALAEARLRLGDAEDLNPLLALAGDPRAALSSRLRALELLGWHGDARTAATLAAQPSGRDVSPPPVLRWAAALAVARSAGSEGAAPFHRRRPTEAEDPVMRQASATYHPRLGVVTDCEDDAACLEKKLAGAGWRAQERAALDLGRNRSTGALLALARRLKGAHPQVQHAILTAMEQLLRMPDALSPSERPQLGSLLLAAAEDPVPAPDLPSGQELRTRAYCLGHRILRPESSP
ncbi:MAG: HEAT repeat domain-containing protein [Deltaproteobacteria bacterium]|nr:HEAT repeat domain-containing protein [Deltaproteobacteria bacterium]